MKSVYIGILPLKEPTKEGAKKLGQSKLVGNWAIEVQSSKSKTIGNQSSKKVIRKLWDKSKNLRKTPVHIPEGLQRFFRSNLEGIPNLILKKLKSMIKI